MSNPNSQPAANSAPAPTRDAQGRFAAGNNGGPGNPFGRRLASMRQAILDCVSEDDIKHVMRKLVERAIEGDVAAAKLVLQYAVGKPQPAPEPDRVEVDEWKVQRDSSIDNDEFEAAAAGLPAPMAIFLAAGMAKGKGPLVAQMIRDQDAEREAEAREEAAELEMMRRSREERAKADRPSRAERNGPFPFGCDDNRPSSTDRNGGQK
jgi:hypothetical protein